MTEDKPREYPDTCQTCGTPVRVIGNTTLSYDSAYEAEKQRADELQAKLEAAERDLRNMTLDRDMFSDRASFLVKKRDELRKQLAEVKLDNYDVSKIIQRKKVEPQITELQAHADALAEAAHDAVALDNAGVNLELVKIIKAYREFRDQGLR